MFEATTELAQFIMCKVPGRTSRFKYGKKQRAAKGKYTWQTY